MTEANITSASLSRLGDIAIRQIRGSGPTLLWLAGYASSMEGVRATWLAAECARLGWNFVVFDYRGTGISGGNFADMTISDWLDDSLKVIDDLIDGPVILVASSMGGWLALKIAQLRADRVKGLALLAPAPDFTKRHWDSLTAEQQATYARIGTLPDDNHHVPLTYKLVADANAHQLILDKPITYNGPVEMMHGLCDPLVSNDTPHKIAELLTSEDVTIHLVKDGSHDLARPHEFAILWEMILRLRGRIIEAD